MKDESVSASDSGMEDGSQTSQADVTSITTGSGSQTSQGDALSITSVEYIHDHGFDIMITRVKVTV